MSQKSKKRLNSLPSWLRPGTKVLIVWKDAAEWSAWVNGGVTFGTLSLLPDVYSPQDCYTVGFFVELSEDKSHILTCGSRADHEKKYDGLGMGGMHAYPLDWIQEIIMLEPSNKWKPAKA